MQTGFRKPFIYQNLICPCYNKTVMSYCVQQRIKLSQPTTQTMIKGSYRKMPKEAHKRTMRGIEGKKLFETVIIID